MAPRGRRQASRPRHGARPPRGSPSPLSPKPRPSPLPLRPRPSSRPTHGMTSTLSGSTRRGVSRPGTGDASRLAPPSRNNFRQSCALVLLVAPGGRAGFWRARTGAPAGLGPLAVRDPARAAALPLALSARVPVEDPFRRPTRPPEAGPASRAQCPAPGGKSAHSGRRCSPRPPLRSGLPGVGDGPKLPHTKNPHAPPPFDATMVGGQSFNVAGSLLFGRMLMGRQELGIPHVRPPAAPLPPRTAGPPPSPPPPKTPPPPPRSSPCPT